MRKKHFDALARALQKIRPHAAHIDAWRAACGAVADVCATFAPKFDRARFLSACGAEDNKS